MLEKDIGPETENEKRLLDALFADQDEPEDNEYPNTITDKVAYAEHCAVSSLDYVGRSIKRLSRFHRMLIAAGDELPKIITYNEAKIARERLGRVQDDIIDAIYMMTQIMDETRQKAPPAPSEASAAEWADNPVIGGATP